MLRNLIINTEFDRPLIIGKFTPLISLLLFQNLLIAVLCASNNISTGINKHFIPKGLISAPWLYTSLGFALLTVMVATVKRILILIQNEIKTKSKPESLRYIEELVKTVRVQCHDFSNHLQVSYGLLEIGACNEAKEYFTKIIPEIAVNLKLIKTDNLEVAALLCTKAGIAEANKIQLEINVKTSLKDLPLEQRDINIILGNVIDNALDAVCDLPAEQRRVELIISKDAGAYIFEITNSGPAKNAELADKVFNFGFTTKGDGRGVGLYSVKKLIEKHSGQVDVVNNSNRITFKICLPLKE